MRFYIEYRACDGTNHCEVRESDSLVSLVNLMLECEIQEVFVLDVNVNEKGWPIGKDGKQ